MNFEKDKYQIFAFSFWCVIAQLSIGIIIPIVLESYLPKMDIILFFLMLSIANLIAWIFARTFLLQPIEIIIKENILIINYLNRSLTEVKKVKEISFYKISRFSDFNTRDLKFKLFFDKGMTFTLYKSNLWGKKDDIEILIVDFKRKIDSFNKIQFQNHRNDNNKAKQIKYGDNTFFILSVIFFIGSFFSGLVMYDSIVSDSYSPIALFAFFTFLALGFICLKSHKWYEK